MKKTNRIIIQHFFGIETGFSQHKLHGKHDVSSDDTISSEECQTKSFFI